MDDLDQHSKMKNMIVTGLQIQPWTRASTVKANGGSNASNASDPGEAVKHQVELFFKAKRISLDLNTINSCPPLPRRKETDKPAIFFRFMNQKDRISSDKQRKI